MGQQLKIFTHPLTGWLAAFLFFSLWILSALAHEKQLSGQKDQKIIESNLIVFNTYRTLSIFDRISQATIKAKQLEDSEHVKVKTVIKTVLKDNECANTDFSDDLTNELRKYERDLRARAASTDTGPLNR
ncbi:hypothetical protein [Providencia heimbachae]|uniref:hypothetical protein n=1 Tax=Providencia heimbachae TaxID=333962 RepID=UPI001FBC0A10|nr:hypothetical protein [Providencia heimbachae]